MRRSTFLIIGALVATSLSVPSQELRAQRRGLRVVRNPVLELGPRVGYDFERDDWTVGGQLRLPIRPVEPLVSGDYYFATGHPWQLNVDVALRLRRLSSLYVGGGIGVFHAGTTDVGPNMLVGLQPPARRSSPIRPYAEGRWTFLDGVPFRLVFGVNLVL